jgi:uncharacterized protein
MTAPRQDVSFRSHDLTCAAWWYPPSALKAPTIVMSHGLTAVKEMYLDRYALAFQKAGFAVLVFDYRFLGASEGTPRGRIVPQDQHDDIRAALTWVSARTEVDAERIGLWGTSFSGGHAMFVGALDPRVKAIVAQVPAIAILDSLVALNGREGAAALLGLCQQEHAARETGQGSMSLLAVAPEGQPCVMPAPDAYRWFTEAARAVAPNWRNEMTVESLARAAEYVPSAFIDLIAPKPLLIQAARHDSLIPIAQTERAFARAGQPKRLDIFDAGHFDLYTEEPHHTRAVTGATAWFKEYL